jgi:branched-chain amino acid transport system ATP-binding protein
VTGAILRLDDVQKRYGALTVSDHVSLEVGPREIHALIGPNGAGKSTLVGEIAGSIRPDAGRVVFDGRDVTRLDVARRARRGLARVFQTSNVIGGFAVLDNVMLAAAATDGTWFRFLRPLAGERQLRDRAMVCLERVGLAGREKVLAGALAHGEKRALELAMGLVQDPKFLLLDEPMAGTGREETERLTELLASLDGKDRKSTRLNSSHNSESRMPSSA